MKKLRTLNFAVLGAFLLSFTPLAHAGVLLEELTWTELRDAVKAGTTTIIIPIGGTEQNGPAMALGKHNTRVVFLAEKIAGKLGSTLVAPVVAYVPEGSIEPPAAHMKFPGTISIPDKAFEQMLEGAARSFKHAGFKTIVLIGDHGSYQENLSSVASRLNAQWKGAAKVFADRHYYDISQNEYVDALLKAGAKDSELGSHAGLADTSLMLAVNPGMVRMDQIKNGPKLGAAEGVYNGDPKNAAAPLGQLGIDLIVNGTVDDIKAFESQK